LGSARLRRREEEEEEEEDMVASTSVLGSWMNERAMKTKDLISVPCGLKF
jgi:hypothetical protein